MAEPKRVLIDYGEFEVEVIVRPKGARPAPRKAPEAKPREGEVKEEGKPSEGRTAVILDQMLRIGSVLEPRVPEGTVIFEAVGVGLEKEVKVSGKLVHVPVRDDFDIYVLVDRLAEEFDKVLLFSGDKALVNDVRVKAAQKGHKNVVVHYMPPSEFSSRAHMIEEILKRIRSA